MREIMPNKDLMHNIIGIILIILGIFLFIVAAADLIFRLIVALVGIYCIAQGLTMRGQSSIYYKARSWIYHQKDRF